MNEKLLTTVDVAKILNVSEQTLRIWRSKNIGPAFSKFGDSKQSDVRYSRRDVEIYIQQTKKETK